MQPGVKWFKGPSDADAAFQFHCGLRGIHIPGLAAILQFQDRSLLLKGVLVSFDEHGYISLEAAGSFIGELGGTADNPIPVSGELAGLTNVQVLKHHPLPEIDCRAAAPSINRSTTEHAYHPMMVAPLEELSIQGRLVPLDEAIQQHTSRLVPAGSYPQPSANTATPYFSTEDGAFTSYVPAIIEPVNKILRDDDKSSSSTCCGVLRQGYRWTPHRTNQSTISREMTQYVPVGTSNKPGIELRHLISKESRCNIEVKGSEVLAPVGPGPGSLVKAWNDHGNGTEELCGGYSGYCKRVVIVISQAYTNTCERGHKYGAITTYEGTWLLCCLENGTLLVSRRYGQHDSNPTPREAIYLLTHLALQPDAVRSPWIGQALPGARGMVRTRSRGQADAQQSGPDHSVGASDKTSSTTNQPVQGGQGPSSTCSLATADQTSTSYNKAVDDTTKQEAAAASNQHYGSSNRRVVQLPAVLVASTTKPLGTGACGTVYMGRHQEHGAVPLQVAIKTALAPHVQELLQNEATIYGHMQAAQGFVVPRLVYGGRGLGDRGYILATELIHGEALSDNNASPELCQAALTALRTVHSMGVLHGDLKRSNLLVDGNKVWLIDFSHASAASDADSTIMMEEEEKLMLDLFKPGWQD